MIQRPAAGASLPGSAGAETLELAGGFSPDPKSVGGTAGGARDAQLVGEGCRGWIPERPHHVLWLRTDFDYLRVEARAAADTMLVMRGPGGVRCDDDSAGDHHPKVDGVFRAGRYELWVGSFQPDEYTRYALTVSAARAGQPSTRPSASSSGQPQSRYGTLTWSGGEPQAVRGEAGGVVGAWQLDPSCSGWIAPQRPDHVLEIPTAVERLSLQLESEAPTTLVIQGPDGFRCSPQGARGLTADFGAGRHQVWVGSHGQGKAGRYTLSVSVRRP